MAALSLVRVELGPMMQMGEPDIFSGPINAGQTYISGALLILSSQALSEGASNQNTAIVGFATHDAVNVYVSGTPSSTTLFGKSIQGGSVFPGEPSNGHAYMIHNNQQFEACVLQAWAANLLGTAFGYLRDATTGFWELDNTQTNKPVTVIAKVFGPQKGVVGDTNARVFATNNASSLAV